MIGSERLSQLLRGHDAGGDRRRVRRGAPARARRSSARERVRAHAILHDDLGVYREEDGEPATTSRASTGRTTASSSSGCARSSSSRSCRAPSPPTRRRRSSSTAPHLAARATGSAGASSAGALAAHLVERYGIEEVARWGFEIWNEANLEVFWTGTQAEYFRLYDVAVRAVKRVDERLLVGGPSTAAAGWIADFLDFVVAEGAPLRLPLHAHVREPPARRRRGAARARPRRRRGVVDGVGRVADALPRRSTTACWARRSCCTG